MDSNNYNARINIWEQLKDMGSKIDSLAQSTMIKEIVCMFAFSKKFKECEQIITFFRAKLHDDDLAEIKEYILKTYNYNLQI